MFTITSQISLSIVSNVVSFILSFAVEYSNKIPEDVEKKFNDALNSENLEIIHKE